MPIDTADSGRASDNAGSSSDKLNSALEAAFSAAEAEAKTAGDDGGMAATLAKEPAAPAPKPAKAAEPELDEEEDADPAEAADEDVDDLDAEEPAPKAKAPAKADSKDKDAKPAKDAKAPGKGKAQADKAPDTPLEVFAPKHWDAGRRAAFDRLPADAKATVLDLARHLEGGFTRKSQELSDKARFADQVSSLFTDHDRAILRQTGVNEAAAVRYLMDLQRLSQQDPVGYVKQAMQTLGVRPEHLFGHAEEPPQRERAQPAAQTHGDPAIEELLRDPKVAQLESELRQQREAIARMAGHLDERSRAETAWQRQQQASQVASIDRSIQDFRSEIDEAGQLKYPHFDQVRAQMGALMQTDPDLAPMADGPDKLARAYEMAVYARPDLRQSLIEAEAARRAADQQRREEAARAKRAAAVRPRSAGAGAAAVRPNGSLESMIEHAMNKAGL